jgi:hypothetical protein
MEDPKPPQVSEPLAETPPPLASPPASPFDVLMLSPEEAAAREKEREQASASKPLEEPEADEPVLLTEVVDKICKAIDRLARKGLNFRAVVALLHDANPTIPKKQIKAILESLRELPAIYGRTADEGTGPARVR